MHVTAEREKIGDLIKLDAGRRHQQVIKTQRPPVITHCTTPSYDFMHIIHTPNNLVPLQKTLIRTIKQKPMISNYNTTQSWQPITQTHGEPPPPPHGGQLSRAALASTINTLADLMTLSPHLHQHVSYGCLELQHPHNNTFI